MVHSNLKFNCVHCGTCCIDKNTLVNLTYTDILRIKNGLNLTIDELFEVLGFYVFQEHPSDEDIKKMVIPPIETENGLAFVGLRKYPTGDCIFYDIKKNRCPIYSVRPNFCRTFPFTFKIVTDKTKKLNEKIKIIYTEKGLEFCQGISKEADNINMDKWLDIGHHVIEDIAMNNILIEKWNNSVRSKKIKPTARNYLLTVIEMQKD